MRIQVKDFMTSPVFTAVESDKVNNVISLMKTKSIHAIPVVRISKQLPANDIKILGIVTASDLSGDVDGNIALSDVMSSRVYVIHKDSAANAAAKMMLKNRVHHLVVMDDGEIVGMISSLDFVKLVADHTLE
ncbi:MAG: CBS domain-containing protein [Chitinophagales bacterium]|nr:CBS domain-containing protein [Chitinophagales bacterium]